MKIRKYTNETFYKITPESNNTLTFWKHTDDILDFCHFNIVYQRDNVIPENLREITNNEAEELDRQRDNR